MICVASACSMALSRAALVAGRCGGRTGFTPCEQAFVSHGPCRSNQVSTNAFCACRRFSASSHTTDCGPSIPAFSGDFAAVGGADSAGRAHPVWPMP